MTYAFVQDVPASWERYEGLAAAISDPIPRGLILHAAGPTDDGFRTIELWDSREAWERFQRRLSLPAGWTLVPPTIRELHALSTVHGERGKK